MTTAVRMPDLAGPDTDHLHRYGLTDRERQVFALIVSGLITKEIAARLGISSHTARHHIERLYLKLGVRSRGAVAAALWRS